MKRASFKDFTVIVDKNVEPGVIHLTTNTSSKLYQGHRHSLYLSLNGQIPIRGKFTTSVGNVKQYSYRKPTAS